MHKEYLLNSVDGSMIIPQKKSMYLFDSCKEFGSKLFQASYPLLIFSSRPLPKDAQSFKIINFRHFHILDDCSYQ